MGFFGGIRVRGRLVCVSLNPHLHIQAREWRESRVCWVHCIDVDI